MGDYTPTQRFYTIDPSELVDVEQHLNYNFRRGDQRIRPLVEYQYTTIDAITASDLPKDVGFKWFKRSTNSIWNYQDGALQQDPNSLTNTWSDTGYSFAANYSSLNSLEAKVGWTVYNGYVRWRGRVHFNAGAAMPANTVTKFLVPPASIRPVRAKYFTVYGGNVTGDFQCFRIYIPDSAAPDSSFEYVKYGGNGSSSAENYISLHDIRYHITDTVGT